MLAKLSTPLGEKTIDLAKPIDISIPLRAGKKNVNAWYANPVTMQPFKMGEFIGSVEQGGAVNTRDILFNPHGNGTHTECVGHISAEEFTINKCLNTFFFIAQLISVEPQKNKIKQGFSEPGDAIITKEQIESVVDAGVDALIIRTLPNEPTKINRQYSSTNPPYLSEAAAHLIRESGIKHLLIDLPSVDRESDGGKMLAHRAFWSYPENVHTDRTITELIYVPNSVADGNYLLNIQIAAFENDASPSKPVLYKLVTEK